MANRNAKTPALQFGTGCETLDSMDLLLRYCEEESTPLESLGELLRRTEYAEEALRHRALETV